MLGRALAGRWWRAAAAVGLALTVVLLGDPIRPPPSLAAVRAHDRALLAGGDRFGDDEVSYRAIATDGINGSYAARRVPFAYRVAEPVVVHWMRPTGLSVTWRFRLFDVIALLALATVVAALGREFGAAPWQADAAAAAVLLGVRCAPNVLTAPSTVIDAGMWAFGAGAWLSARRGRPLAAALCLAAATMVAETGLLFLPLVVFELGAPRRWRRWGAVVLGAAVGFAAPRLLVTPSFDPGLRKGVVPALHKNLSALVHLRVTTLTELTLAGVGLPLVVIVVGARREFLVRALLVVAGFVPVALCAFETGRHVVPVGLVLAPALALRLRSPAVATVAVAGAFVAAVARIYGNGFVVAELVAMAALVVAVRWAPRELAGGGAARRAVGGATA